VTAFAAVVSLDGRQVERSDVLRLAGILAGVYGTPPIVLDTTGPCALVAARLDEGDAGHFSHQDAGVVITGQVLLEGAGDVIGRLDLAPHSSSLEIVTAAYLRCGERCTEHLTGEFAFALWDAHRRLLLAGRDGLGVRPLYAGEGRGVAVVSNVLAAVVAHPAVPAVLDDQALVQFLALGEAAPGRTAYRHVKSVPAGHTLQLTPQSGHAALSRHWWFPQKEDQGLRTEADVLEGYRAVLGQAVADRVRGPATAILLSGGVDSTTIAAAARLACPGIQLRAFTATYDRLPAAC
jgi:asparagine synthase (glutamine-hydrolysing)